MIGETLVRKITMKIANSIGRISLKSIAPWVRAAALAAMTLASTAHGQALDAADVQQRGADAEIIIRFATQILYLRHNPREEGRSVRIYLRIVGVGLQDADLTPDSRRLGALEPAPGATIRFPEPDGALSISFDQATRFSVRPGSDGRSISILIPAKPGG
jgi:hypothetical protein